MIYADEEMTRDEIREEVIENVAEYFGIELECNEDGKYDLEGYDWQAGCYLRVGGESQWFSPKTVVDCIMSML